MWIDSFKIRSGYRVFGHNTSNGQESIWTFQDIEMANQFAENLCHETGKEVDVCKYLGSWRMPKPEFIKSEN